MEWFNRMTILSHQDFKEFAFENEFGDTTFSLTYAWAERFNYCYRKFDGCIAVCGRGLDNNYGFYIIRKKDAPIDEAGDYILEFCLSRNIIPVFEFIKENEIEIYRKFAENRGLIPKFEYSDSLSDYIYNSSDYISLTGNINKTKRGNVNKLMRNYPYLKYVTPYDDTVRAIMPAFRKWCESRCCADCHYGCEFRAFSRFLKLYGGSEYIVRLAVSGGEILSFFAGEITSPQTICCYFQKNIGMIRGLTYWLSRCVMEEFSYIKYLNLGEDMGIKGIIDDKMSLHPYRKAKKYTMVVRSGFLGQIQIVSEK